MIPVCWGPNRTTWNYTVNQKWENRKGMIGNANANANANIDADDDYDDDDDTIIPSFTRNKLNLWLDVVNEMFERDSDEETLGEDFEDVKERNLPPNEEGPHYRPFRVLEKLKRHTGPEVPQRLLRSMFLSRLPSNIRSVIAANIHATLDELAMQAETMCLQSDELNSHVVRPDSHVVRPDSPVTVPNIHVARSPRGNTRRKKAARKTRTYRNRSTCS